jgi:parvulin-like peptidyl-prolyl isomerase
MDEKKKKFNWTEFIAVTLLVLLSALVAAGLTWYVMDNQLRDEQADRDAQVASYQARIASLEAKNKVDAVVDKATTAQALTAAMIEGGSYTLGSAKVTLVAGKATVGDSTYTLDTKNVAYTTDKTKAVVVIKQTTGTSTTPVNTYVVAVVNKDGKASQVASATVASGSTVSSVSYGSDGKITITTTSEVLTTPVTKTYTITGTSFTEAK